MELPFPSALGPCMVVVSEAYAGLVQERWAVFVDEVEQLVRYLHGLSVARNGSGGGVCGHWLPRGLGGGYPPTHPHPPPPPPPRPDPTRPKGHPGFAPEAAHRPADGGGSFSLAPSPPAPRIPRGRGALAPGSDAGSLRSESGRSSASSTVVGPPFPVSPTPPRPGGRAPTAVVAAAAADDDDACPSCRRTGGRVDAPGLRRSSRRNRPRDVRAEYDAGETPGEAE